MAGPRITPLPDDQWDDAVRDALSPLLPAARANLRDSGNVLGTLVRHRDLTRAYLEFNVHVLRSSTLPERAREVALLRAVQARGSDYLWEHHVPLAARVGVTPADVEGIRVGEPSDAVDRLVVRVVDEIERSSTVCDATWSALREHFDDRQIMDLVFTIGCYQLLAVAVNVLGIQSEEQEENRPR